MNNKQIEEKLQEIEERNPARFSQYKLKDHLHWSHVEGTNTLKWNFHPHFIGNLPIEVKTEVSKLMNKLTKTGYKVDSKPGAAEEKKAEAKTEEKEESVQE